MPIFHNTVTLLSAEISQESGLKVKAPFNMAVRS